MDLHCGVCGKDTVHDAPLILFGNVVYHEDCWDTLAKEERGIRK